MEFIVALIVVFLATIACILYDMKAILIQQEQRAQNDRYDIESMYYRYDEILDEIAGVKALDHTEMEVGESIIDFERSFRAIDAHEKLLDKLNIALFNQRQYIEATRKYPVR